MTEEQINREVWLLTMAVGIPMIMILCWIGILPISA